MNERIKALEEHYQAVIDHKAILASDALFHPSISSMLSQVHEFLGVIEAKVYEKLQKLRQKEEEALQKNREVVEKVVAILQEHANTTGSSVSTSFEFSNLDFSDKLYPETPNGEEHF